MLSVGASQGFPRELGFIRTKQLMDDIGEAGALIELIIPRVSPDGAAAQFRVNAVPGQNMLSMYKQVCGATSPPRAPPPTAAPVCGW